MVTALAGAVLSANDRSTLTLLREIVLHGKPLVEVVDENLGTDLLCLVNFKLDQPPPLNQVEYYAQQVEKDLKQAANLINREIETSDVHESLR